MPRPLGCQFCRTPLAPAREFAFHVQSATASDPHPLTGGDRLPHRNGQPLRCCRRCEERIVTVRRVAQSPPGVGIQLLVSAAVLVGRRDSEHNRGLPDRAGKLAHRNGEHNRAGSSVGVVTEPARRR